MIDTRIPEFKMRPAVPGDEPQILALIRQLAAFERLSHEVVATENALGRHLFGERPAAEVLLGFYGGQPVSFALFFQTFSTFLGRPGIHLEDLFVVPDLRGRGIGGVMLAYVARIARQRDCGRLEWSVLDWNAPAIRLYRQLGATPMTEWILNRMTGDALERLAERF